MPKWKGRKMVGGDSADSGGWNTASLLYGLIILLYFGVAAVFLWYFSNQQNVDRMKHRWWDSFQNFGLIDLYCRNLRKQRRQEYYERERRRGRKEYLKNIETMSKEPSAEENEQLEDYTKPLTLKKTE